MEKGLDYALIQRKINEPELRRSFNDFCRMMRLKWYFRDEPDTMGPSQRATLFGSFLSQVETEFFKMSRSSIRYCNVPKDELDA